jgi:hypothetical protein
MTDMGWGKCTLFFNYPDMDSTAFSVSWAKVHCCSSFFICLLSLSYFLRSFVLCIVILVFCLLPRALSFLFVFCHCCCLCLWHCLWFCHRLELCPRLRLCLVIVSIVATFALPYLRVISSSSPVLSCQFIHFWYALFILHSYCVIVF